MNLRFVMIEEPREIDITELDDSQYKQCVDQVLGLMTIDLALDGTVLAFVEGSDADKRIYLGSIVDDAVCMAIDWDSDRRKDGDAPKYVDGLRVELEKILGNALSQLNSVEFP